MKYDFIIVGGGPAGATLASRLASSKAAPEVLLLEAGARNDDPEATRLSERYFTVHQFPEYNWGYMSEPQEHLKNRTVSYARGKGLGGSSSINFCFCDTRGSQADYDEWARIVGDESFNWANAERRFKKFEGFEPIQSDMHKKHTDWKPENHGTRGPVTISDSAEWESFQEDALLAGLDEGFEKNLDLNSGNEIGIGVGAATGSKSHRVTARTAFLSQPPSNLTIIIHAPATKVLFDGKRAIGVHAGGKDYHADKEVILCAGALDTPKLLMLSGVGPKDELQKHDIPLVADLPVGIGLQDHLHLPLIMQVKDGSNLRPAWSTEQAMAEAKERFQKDGTGPLSIMYCSAIVGFLKGSNSVYESEEFKNLPKETQDYVKQPTVPAFEISAAIPTYPLPGYNPLKTYSPILVFGMVPQSRGTVTLRSNDPKDPPVCDPKFLSHPFDLVTLTDGVRRAHKWLRNPIMTRDIVATFAAPASDSNEDIQEYIRNYGVSTWHMSCTAMMGKPDDSSAVVTTDFKVKGFDGLRVADVSVTPLLPNAHTVSVAYLIGETASEKLIEEYGLDS